ncbi:alpha/beta fold hydrolase [Tropicimonas sp.]|uniref:alpha/beta fold hydrolase n=1 Tax=Tropicimonas sp. TaxID=2067044 RepID=UPI003A867D06
MADRIRAGRVNLGCRIWGTGPVPVLFVHGNLASKDWIELAAPWVPADLRIIGIDWRGCGDSDRPAPVPGYTNYSMQRHAEDMIAALDTLGVARCHLATHSTGGFIAARMQLMQPDRFGKILALDPVAPFGLKFEPRAIDGFRAMQAGQELTRKVMAGVAPALFRGDVAQAGGMPEFRSGIAAQARLFDRIVRQSFAVADGIWLGTPLNLTAEFDSGEVAARVGELRHETLVLWGERDGIIPLADMQRMAAELPDCRLVRVPGIGHSMNIEAPLLYAGYFGAMFSGVPV